MLKKIKEFGKKPVTWGGYWKLAGWMAAIYFGLIGVGWAIDKINYILTKKRVEEIPETDEEEDVDIFEDDEDDRF